MRVVQAETLSSPRRNVRVCGEGCLFFAEDLLVAAVQPVGHVDEVRKPIVNTIR